VWKLINETQTNNLMNQINIGRNASSDIVVPAQYKTVSGDHVTIRKSGNSFLLEDHSTNGTYVNGTQVQHDICNIAMSDTILLGRSYALNMAEVARLLNNPAGGTQIDDGTVIDVQAREMPRASRPAQPNIYVNVQQEQHQQQPNPQPSYQQARPQSPVLPTCLDKWSWGGFTFGWLYGVFNGIYWPLIIFIPVIGWLAAPIINIMLGVKAHSQAWEKFAAKGTEAGAAIFDSKQQSWDRWGLILFIINLVISVLYAIGMIILTVVADNSYYY